MVSSASTPLRVCIISPGILPVPATKGGAIETLIMSLVKINESERRMDLTVMSIADPKAEELSKQYPHTHFRFFTPSSAVLDKPYHYGQALLKRVLPHSHVISSLYYRSVLKSIRGENFDAVVFEGGESRGFTAYDKAFGGKLWYHVHANPVGPTESATFGDVMVLSEFVLKNWQHWCSDKSQRLHVLYNGVNTELFERAVKLDASHARALFRYDADDFVVLYCGRISSEKGVKELIEAVESIDDEHVKLRIVGAPDRFAYSQQYDKEMRALAEPAGDRIAFTGYVRNDHLAEHYAAADVQVVPSQWEEGAGNVCIEGMAAGKPIIASNCGGIPEYVDGECAVLVDRGDSYVNDLADAIVTLRNDPDRRLRMSEHGRERAKRFSEHEYYDRYVRLLARTAE